ncbi:hypothetical protein [Psychrobacter sp. KFRI-CH2-11]|uniref:hypothetical protein n=1 Tax=Psychrobacter sp. KFRI-CH2-11 TaxID=3156079 RepID=UPI003312FCC2
MTRHHGCIIRLKVSWQDVPSRYGSQLLLILIYDQDKKDGPPFSVDEASIQQYYGQYYQIDEVETPLLLSALCLIYLSQSMAGYSQQ